MNAEATGAEVKLCPLPSDGERCPTEREQPSPPAGCGEGASPPAGGEDPSPPAGGGEGASPPAGGEDPSPPAGGGEGASPPAVGEDPSPPAGGGEGASPPAGGEDPSPSGGGGEGASPPVGGDYEDGGGDVGGDGEDWEYEWPPAGYEYLDHPADVQLHAWGTCLMEAFEQTALAMFGYMTELDTVEQREQQEVTAEGHDIESLLFHFLDEWLFLFSAEPFFVASRVQVVEFDRQQFRIRARGFGEQFDLSKHPQGTEVKAITYANLQVHDTDDVHEVYVIIDI